MTGPGTRPAGRVMVIEGRRTLVVERARPIPPKLEQLLEGGRDATGRLWTALRVTVRQPLAIGGWRAACSDQDHRLGLWLEGFHTGSDAIVRYLRLFACSDCAAVCVRDASLDSLPNLPAGRQQLRRRDAVIGWYSGARRSQRQYT